MYSFKQLAKDSQVPSNAGYTSAVQFLNEEYALEKIWRKLKLEDGLSPAMVMTANGVNLHCGC